MASRQMPQASDVLVTLSAKSHRSDFQYPERRVVLKFEPENPPSVEKPTSISIGRTSRRFEHLGAKQGNCYFDSPVMSREHAVIIVDWWHKKVFIKDIGSLHGTFHNSQRLPQHELREVGQGDIIKFGVDIQRSNELFPPCTVEVHFEFNHLAEPAKAQPNGRPTFAVPDESDSSDDEEDDKAESDVSPSVEKLRNIEQRRSDNVRSSSVLESIDLTEDDPPHAPQVVQRRETIVLDDDDTANVVEPPSSLPVPMPSGPEIVELDAPHDVEEEEEPVHTVLKEIIDGPLGFDSGSESDDSYEDNDAHDYPDDEMSSEDGLSSQDEAHDASDEEIHLTDSESEDLSQDEEDIDLENEDDSESENEDMEVDDIGTTADLLFDDGEYEPEAEEHTCADECRSGDVCNDVTRGRQPTQPELTAAKQYYAPSPYMPPASSFQSPMPSLREPLPPIWPAVLSEQGEQVRPNDFKLHSLLNPANPPLSLPDFNSNPLLGSPSEYQEYRRTAAMLANITARQYTPAAPHAPWQSPLVTPQPVCVVEEKNSWGLPQNDGPSAEDLGQMTGKPEYFAAREHNKAVMRRQEELQGRSPLPPSAARTATTNEKTAPKVTTNTIVGRKPAEPIEEAPKSTKVPESAWAATGKKFLNSPPPQDFPVSNVRARSPEFDMESAFQFHKSKLAALSPQAPTSHITTVDTQRALPRSPKRKADEISTLQPEEEAMETASSKQQNEAVVQDAVPTQASSIAPATSTLNTTEPPPAKRARFLPSLGSIGTFSFGGVMISSVVVGVLAATAPSL